MKFSFAKTTQVITALTKTGVSKNDVKTLKKYKHLPPEEFINFINENYFDVFFEGCLHQLPEFSPRCDFSRLSGLQIYQWMLKYSTPPPAVDWGKVDGVVASLIIERFNQEYLAYLNLSALNEDDWSRVLLWRPNLIHLPQIKNFYSKLDWVMLGTWQDSLNQYICDEDIQSKIAKQKSRLRGHNEFSRTQNYT